MNRLTDARNLLAAAAEPVLPGRVFGYGTSRAQRGVAPYVWITNPAVNPETVGTATTVWVAEFPVHVVVDGAGHAQAAGYDEIVARLVDAFEATRGMQVRGVAPDDVDDGAATSTATITVAATIAARTLCPPTPTAAVMPPEPIPA